MTVDTSSYETPAGITATVVKDSLGALTAETDKTEIVAGYTADKAPKCSVSTQLKNASTTYQWYQVGADSDTKLVGATERTYTMEPGLALGTYQYYCTVAADGVMKKSEAVEITVSTECHHTITVLKNERKATCVTNGYTGDECCKNCGKVLKAGKEILAKGHHSWDEGTVTKEPTTTQEGVKTYTCTVCGASRTESIPVRMPQVGEVLTEKTLGVSYEVTQAGIDGTVTYKGPTLADAPVAGKKSITVPATVTIDGVTYRVTAIGDKAFAKCRKVTKITVGKNITTIGKQAFSGCKKLKTLTIKSTKLTKKTVAKKAFKGFPTKAVIKVPKKQRSTYKKLFKSKGLSSKVKIK